MSTDPISFDDTAIAFASRSDEELRKARWMFRLMGNEMVVDIGSHLTRMALRIGLPVQSLVKQTIYSQFCGGETLEESIPVVDRLGQEDVSTILDYGVEAKESDAEFDANVEEQIRAIVFANGRASVPYISCKITGYTSFSLLERMSAGEQTPEDAEAIALLKVRLTRICESAAGSDVAVYIDAEESWIQDAVDALVDALMVTYNIEKPVVFTTVQLYRHDRLAFLKRSHQAAEAGGYFLGVKLVRGAYMDKERARAAERGYPSPIHADKAAVDADFDEALSYCLEHIDRVAFCAATHNEASSMHLVRAVVAAGVDLKHPHVHFAQLMGMSDHISFNLARAGFNTSKYVPYGPVRDVVPYLIRRAEENRSISGQVGRELRLIQEEIKRRTDA
ncbi:MAG: proline dehydrogenase family protein [Myxococcota bacterium]|nr:proline dehydrogenase family protein [Myxococcota bacterium]